MQVYEQIDFFFFAWDKEIQRSKVRRYGYTGSRGQASLWVRHMGKDPYLESEKYFFEEYLKKFNIFGQI